MSRQRKFSAEFKVKLALEALPDELTFAELASKYSVQSRWFCAWRASHAGQSVRHGRIRHRAG